MNMSQSGEGDRFADTITDASDGRCSFPDLDLGNGAGSNPYDFLQSPLQCYWYAMLARDGLLNCATTTLSPTARGGSSSGSNASTPRGKREKKRGIDDEGSDLLLTRLADQQDLTDSLTLITNTLLSGTPVVSDTNSKDGTFLLSEQVKDIRRKRFEELLNALEDLATAEHLAREFPTL